MIFGNHSKLANALQASTLLSGAALRKEESDSPQPVHTIRRHEVKPFRILGSDLIVKLQYPAIARHAIRQRQPGRPRQFRLQLYQVGRVHLALPRELYLRYPNLQLARNPWRFAQRELMKPCRAGPRPENRWRLVLVRLPFVSPASSHPLEPSVITWS